MTNYAKTESKVVWIKYDFGNDLARKWFGDEAIDAVIYSIDTVEKLGDDAEWEE